MTSLWSLHLPHPNYLEQNIPPSSFLCFCRFVLFCFLRESYQVAQVGLELSQLAALASKCWVCWHALPPSTLLRILITPTRWTHLESVLGGAGVLYPLPFSPYGLFSLHLPLTRLCPCHLSAMTALSPALVSASQTVQEKLGKCVEVCGIRDKNPWLLFGKGCFWQLTDTF